ncbi:MAG: hypothetical protein JO143_06650 [Acetobacteraceae bacterium]|nr:hypothetical protein [Acetobacteraceae bacterium]
MPEFPPVETVSDFKTLDDGDVLEGYLDGFHGAGAPDSTRSRGYWHGWHNGMIESRRMPATPAYRRLAEAFRRLA